MVLAGNGLRELPGVSRLQQLNTLVLSHNAFEVRLAPALCCMPRSFQGRAFLKACVVLCLPVMLADCQSSLLTVPRFLHSLASWYLCILCSLPHLTLPQEFPSVGVLPGLRKLSLSHNSLRTLPPTTPSAVPALSELRLAHNKLVALPPATALSPWSARLRVLDVGHNRIRSFADAATMLVGVRVLSVTGNATAETGTWAAVRVLDGARVDGCGRGGRPLDPAAVAAVAAARAKRDAAAVDGAGDAAGVTAAVGATAAADEEKQVSDVPAAGRLAKRARRTPVDTATPATGTAEASSVGTVAPVPAKDAPAAAVTGVPPLSFDDVARSRGVASTPDGDGASGGDVAAGAGGAVKEDDAEADLLAASAADAAATVVRVTVARRVKEKGRSKRQRARAKREAEAAAQAEAGVEERFGLGGESAW